MQMNELRAKEQRAAPARMCPGRRLLLLAPLAELTTMGGLSAASRSVSARASHLAPLSQPSPGPDPARLAGLADD